MKYLLLAFLILPFAHAEETLSPDDLIKELRAQYEELQTVLKEKEFDPAKFGGVFETLRTTAKKVYEHPEAIANQIQTAADVEGRAGRYAAAVDAEKYLGTFRQIVQHIISVYDPGHVNAGTAELWIIEIDTRPMNPENAKLLIEKMKTFAEVYGEHPTAGFRMAIDANGLHLGGHEVAATEIVEEGLKLFPGNKALQNAKGLYALQGTEAQLVTKKLDGEEFDISSLKGKVVLLEFWASWCGPCKTLSPELVKLYEKYKDVGLEIVGFSNDYRQEDLEAYLSEHPHPWIQLYEPDMIERIKLGKQFFVSWIPTLFVVSKSGRFETVGLNADPKLIEQKILEALTDK